MRTTLRVLGCVGLVALGYVLGATGPHWLPGVNAQVSDEAPSEQAQDKIRQAYGALRDAADILRQEGRYRTATVGINAFAVTVGGVDAIDDLEKGRGVDPETFAALYAGRAIKEVQDHLSYDDKGRLLYKNKVVRMYSVERLKKLFQERLRYAGPAGLGSP